MLKLKLQYLAIWWEEPVHWKRLWWWERLKAGGEGDNRGWDGWMALLTQWTWVWANSRRWWRTGKPGVLQSMGLQRVGHDQQLHNNNHCIHLTYISLCVHAKSLQLRPTLCDPMDCSLPGFSVHRQAYWSVLPWPPPGIFPTQGWNPRLLHLCIGRRVLYH